MLAELMRLKSNIAIAGTHGKTTTTTMVAELMVAGNLTPRRERRHHPRLRLERARWGRANGWWSRQTKVDGTFNRLPATIAIVTNIDPEHMEHWGTEEALHQGLP